MTNMLQMIDKLPKTVGNSDPARSPVFVKS